LFLKQCNVFKFEILKSKKKRLKYETKDMWILIMYFTSETHFILILKRYCNKIIYLNYGPNQIININATFWHQATKNLLNLLNKTIH
jgi:hypothetical protein